MGDVEIPDEAREARRQVIELLREAGYLVMWIPPCKVTRDHGKHILVTRSATCPGGGTIPHGLQSTWHGSFGWWANCQCGDSFAMYGADDEPTNWDKHQAEHGLGAFAPAASPTQDGDRDG